MAVWSVVRVSELEGPTRLDAEYYRPKYFRPLDALPEVGGVSLEQVAKKAKRRRFALERRGYGARD